jgi:sarcosine oxidase subunit gamma
VTIPTDLGHINLRGDPQNANFIAAAERVLDQPLPIEANTISLGDHRIYWLGPDEWLIVTMADTVSDLVDRLQHALAKLHAAVNDVSGGQVALSLSGTSVRDVLAKGCTLDLHPQVFRIGSCAQSGLAKANVLLGPGDDANTFDIVVRRSFSDYLVRWLQQAGDDFGIEFR